MIERITIIYLKEEFMPINDQVQHASASSSSEFSAGNNRLMLFLTPVIVVFSGIVALLIAGWNSSQIAPLQQWSAEKAGSEIYARVIHESTLSPGLLLQSPDLLGKAIASDPEIIAAYIMQGDTEIAGFIKQPGFVLNLSDLPQETSATILNGKSAAYRRFVGPGNGNENGRRHSGGGKGPHWLRTDGIPENHSGQNRLNLIFVFSGPDPQLIMPLIYQMYLWPLVWLFLTILWGMIIILQRRATRLQYAIQKETHLASIGKMSARLAHEIRNPLAAIRGMAQLLQNRLKAPDELNMAKTIERETFRLDDLTRSILDFSRPTQCRLIPLNSTAVITNTIELFKNQNSEAVISFLKPDVDYICSGDENAVRQILLNLLKNAIENAEENSQVSVKTTAIADKLIIAVTNHGTALSEQMLETVFEPFVSTRTHGYGLGLPISRRLAEMMGGTLNLKNLSAGMITAELTLELEKKHDQSI